MTMKYYIAVNKQAQGPYEINELKQHGVTPDTMLWHEGMTSWVAARDIPEVKAALFQNSTPPIADEQQKPKTWLVESILCTVFCCQIFGIIAIVMSALAESTWGRKDYAEAKNKSKQARTWVLVSFITGLVGVFFYIIYLVVLITLKSSI